MATVLADCSCPHCGGPIKQKVEPGTPFECPNCDNSVLLPEGQRIVVKVNMSQTNVGGIHFHGKATIGGDAINGNKVVIERGAEPRASKFPAGFPFVETGDGEDLVHGDTVDDQTAEGGIFEGDLTQVAVGNNIVQATGGSAASVNVPSNAKGGTRRVSVNNHSIQLENGVWRLDGKIVPADDRELVALLAIADQAMAKAHQAADQARRTVDQTLERLRKRGLLG